jgi:hypothetical protein
VGGSRRIADAEATGEPHSSVLGVPLSFGSIQGKAAISSTVWHDPRSFLLMWSVRSPTLLPAMCGWLRKARQMLPRGGEIPNFAD